MSSITIPRAYTLLSEDSLDEYKGKGFLFRHKATGCEIYHVHNDDEENLFSFNFRTPPEKGDGVAHILEHSVLCGSRHFPVKDPFLSMMKGSVNTFLNAMTYPDKTLYPAASVLEKDFFNLMDVYGDAVFFPQLKEEVFRQEGHRLERSGENGLQRTGIVYNEMKGSYSSQDGIAYEWATRSLFPDNPYGVDSGGEPSIIPSLSYEEFKAFHQRYYHPANCRIFLYGNIPSEKILTFLDERFLSEFSASDSRDSSAVPFQENWSEPRRVETGWPVGEGDDCSRKTTLALNWKISGHEDPVRNLSMSILSELLMGNAGAPLYKALLESGLGEDLSPVSGVDYDLNEGMFSVGLRGSDPEQAEAFRELVFKVLSDLAEKGFDEDLKESCLRLVEFRAREVKGGGPFGMRLLKKVMRGWNYDRNPGACIRFAPVMEEVREKAQSPGYFEGLLNEWILDNSHWTLLTVRPDPDLKNKLDQAEAEELASLAASMSPAEWTELDEKNEALRIFQESEDQGQVPFLEKSDIPRKVKVLDVQEEQGRIPLILSQNVFTNGILYNDMSFSLKDMEDKWFCYLPLFCKFLTGTGLPGVPYDKVSREIAMKTGGLGASLEASHKVGDQADELPESFLYVRLKMLESQCTEALELTSSLLLDADFDNLERMEQIVMELWNDLKSSLVPGGHSYVMIRNSSRFSSSARREDLMYGIGQLQFLEELKSRKDYLQELSLLMKDLRKRVFALDNMSLSLVMDEDVMSRQKSAVVSYWEEVLPDVPLISRNAEAPSPLGELPPSPPASGKAEALAVSASVGYVGKILKGSALGSDEIIPDSLLSQMMKTGPLWEKIRMKGGAYGAFSTHSGLDQVFSFATYRDPEILRSLEAFKESLEEFSEFEDMEELDKAVISVAGKELKPQSPSEKSMIALKRHLYFIDDALRQKGRDLLLSCLPSDISESSARLLKGWEQDGITVMAHPEKLDEAALTYSGLRENRIDLPQ